MIPTSSRAGILNLLEPIGTSVGTTQRERERDRGFAATHRMAPLEPGTHDNMLGDSKSTHPATMEAAISKWSLPEDTEVIPLEFL